MEHIKKTKRGYGEDEITEERTDSGSSPKTNMRQKMKTHLDNSNMRLFATLLLLVVLGGSIFAYWLVATSPGWHRSEDSTYYIVPGTRSRATGFYFVNGTEYLFEEDGILVQGWGSYDDETYYCDELGRRQYGIQTVQDARYLLDKNGRLQTGVAWYQGDAYLADAEGRLQTGWQEYESARYWLDPDTGHMAFGLKQLDDGYYFFAPETGAMQFGCFVTQGDETYYLNEDGLAVTGWQTIQGETYYFTSAATMAVGYNTLEDNLYYFDENGMLMTGFAKLDGALHYFGEDGVIRPCAQIYEGVERLFHNDGQALEGWQALSGEQYYYREGIRQSGVIDIEGASYQLGADGIFRTGWRGSSYYNEYGFALTGWHTLDGVLRHFDANGVMSVSTTIGDYTIDANGVAQRTVPAGGSVSACYNFVRGHMRYAAIGADTYEAMVAYALDNGRGACYHYAALLHYTLANSGIDSTVIWGLNPQGGTHVWVQLTDGHIVDACNGYYMITTDQMANMGYTW